MEDQMSHVTSHNELQPSQSKHTHRERSSRHGHSHSERRRHHGVNASQQVNFDGVTANGEEHVTIPSDMNSMDIQNALTYYKRMDQSVIEDLIVECFDEKCIESMVQELLVNGNKNANGKDSTSVSRGKLKCSDIFERFYSVPNCGVKKSPKGIFETDTFPYKTERTNLEHTGQSNDPSSAFTDLESETPKHPSGLKSSFHEGPQNKSPRIGDITTAQQTAEDPFVLPFPSQRNIDLNETESNHDGREPEESSAQVTWPYAETRSTILHPTIRDIDARQHDHDPWAKVSFAETEIKMIWDFAKSYSRVILADCCVLFVSGHLTSDMYKLTSTGELEKVEGIEKCSLKEMLKNGKSVLDNDIKQGPQTRFANTLEEHNKVKHRITIPILQADRPPLGAVVYKRCSENSPPFPVDLFHTVAKDVGGFVHHVLKSAHYRKALNTYRILGRRFNDSFLEPRSWDSNIYKFLLLVKADLSPQRVHLFRLDHDSGTAAAVMYDTGKSSEFGYHFDYSQRVRLPISTTFLRNIRKLKDFVNVTRETSAWLAGNSLQKLLPGPPIDSFLALPFSEDWASRALDLILLINAPNHGSFSTNDRQIVTTYMQFLHFSLGCIVTRSRLQAAAQCPSKDQQGLLYHLQLPSNENAKELLKFLSTKDWLPNDISDINFDARKYLAHPFILPACVIWMMDQIVGMDAFHREKRASFVLAVRKGYRKVSYHNWTHGVQVAHCLYIIVKQNPRFLSPLERKSLLIAALCHDLNHVGFNAQFCKKHVYPLKTLYPNSPLEYMHVRETFSLFACTETDILTGWTDLDKLEFMRIVKHAILCTDLARHASEVKVIQELVNKGADITSNEHRSSLIWLLMSAADLSTSTKDWECHVRAAHDLYSELHLQAELEKLYGERVAHKNDRTAKHMPEQEVEFLETVCLPLFKLLSEVMPHTYFLRDGCEENVVKWKDEIRRRRGERVHEDEPQHYLSHHSHEVKGHPSHHSEHH